MEGAVNGTAPQAGEGTIGRAPDITGEAESNETPRGGDRRLIGCRSTCLSAGALARGSREAL